MLTLPKAAENNTNLYCCISVCKNYKDPDAKVDLYPLPNSIYEKSLWCKVLNIPASVAVQPTARVCGLHFRYKYFLNQKDQQSGSNQPLTFIVNNNRGSPIITGHATNSNVPTKVTPNSGFRPLLSNTTAIPGKVLKAFIYSPNAPQSSLSSLSKTPPDVSISSENASSPTNLLAKGELMLECQEETLSQAQLSANDSDWTDFIKIVQNVEPNITKISENITPSAGTNIREQNINITTNYQVGIPVSLPSGSLGTTFMAIPSPNVTIPPAINTTVTGNPQTFTNFSNIVNPSSATVPQFISINPQNSDVRGTVPATSLPQIFQIQAPNSSGNIQILNTPSVVGPQILQIGNQSIQFYTTSNMNVQQPVSGLSLVPNSNSVLINNQAIPNSGGNFISTPINLTESNTNLNNSNALTSLPTTVQPSDSSVKEIFPVLLKKNDDKEATPEVILPLLPEEGNAETIVCEVTPMIEKVPPSSTNFLDAPSNRKTDDVDFSNVTAIYGSESTPIVSAIEKNKVSVSQSLHNGGEVFQVVSKNTSDHSRGSEPSILRKYFEEKKVPEPALKPPPPPYPSSSQGPRIVDVMSAKEGGQALYTSFERPAIIFEKPVKPVENTNKTPATAGENTKVEKTVNVVQGGQQPNKQQNPSILHSFPKVMHIHSIFSLQKSIPVIPATGNLYPDTHKLFLVKTFPVKNNYMEAQYLRTKLRKSEFLQNHVWWLQKMKCLPSPSICTCGNKMLQMNYNNVYYDGYSWVCRNKKCVFQEPIKRPKFFEKFKGYSLQDLMLLTYHWACQSDIEEILRDVNLDVGKIWFYFKALQELCYDSIMRSGKLGACQRSRIEVGVVKLGNHFILGALERFNRSVRLQAIPIDEAFETSQHLKYLESWINTNCTIISESKIPDQFLRNRYKVASDPYFLDAKSNGYHILNVSRYLVKNMISMFGKLKFHVLQKHIIQGFLNELMWRERFGKSTDQAFWNILNHITKLNPPIRDIVGLELGEVQDEENIYLRESHPWGPIKPEIDDDSSDSVNNSDDNSCEILEVKEISVIEQEINQNTAVVNDKPFAISIPKKVKLGWSANSTLSLLFIDIPEIPGGEESVTNKALVTIRIHLNDDPEYLEKYKRDSSSLGLRLSAEGFRSGPVRWLVKKGFIKSTAPCYVCHGTSYLRDNPRFDEGCSWLCQSKECKFENIFKRPHFYARFPMLPMDHMSAMIFHWTAQSDLSRITHDAPMDVAKLYHVWRSFQVLCSTSLRKKKLKLGGEQEVIEIAMVRFGKLYILGAMERKTKYTLLKTFFAEIHGQIPELFKVLSQWILPNSFVVVNGTKYFEMSDSYHVMLADLSITDPQSSSFHVLNITSYLLRHISFLFGHFKAEDVKAEVVQVYLDELMWRERFGRMPTEAFYNILKDIFELEVKGYFTSQTRQSSSDENKEKIDEPCMYDILAVCDSKNDDSKQNTDAIPILNSEEVIDPAHLPQVDVVLKRLSKEVLMYYNCWPPSDFVTKPDPMSVPTTKKYVPKLKLKKDTEKVYYETVNPSLLNHTNQRTYAKTRRTEETSYTQVNVLSNPPSTISTKRGKETSDDDDCVIDVCSLDDYSLISKKAKLSYSSNHKTKVENKFTEIKNKELRKSAVLTESVHKKEIKSAIITEPEHKDEIIISDNESNQDESVCVECGKNIAADIDHFKKKFICMDCKRSVYKTSCCNSFMEHRGHLLFGNRMPRRNISETHSLHKTIILKDLFYCSCGYTTNIGNRLASHLVACKKSTCYYHADIS